MENASLVSVLALVFSSISIFIAWSSRNIAKHSYELNRKSYLANNAVIFDAKVGHDTPVGKAIPFTFFIRNTGKSTLTIIKVEVLFNGKIGKKFMWNENWTLLTNKQITTNDAAIEMTYDLSVNNKIMVQSVDYCAIVYYLGTDNKPLFDISETKSIDAIKFFT